MKTEQIKIPFNSIVFGLPGQNFEIDSHVTAEERLPVVTEFAIRLIHICGGLNRSDFRDYFGLTDLETDLLIDWLIAQHLIQIDNDRLVTTPYAEDKFAASSDELPRFSRVEPRKDIVNFELLTFSLMDKQSTELTLGSMVELPVLDEANISESNKKAEAAYQTNFFDIVGKSATQTRELYKISSVRGRKSFFAPIPVTFSLDESSQVYRHVPEDDKQKSELLLVLNGAISDLISAPLSVQLPHLLEFVEVFEDRVIGQFLSAKVFNFERYVEEVFRSKTVSYPSGTVPILGNLYLEENSKVLQDWLATATTSEFNNQKSHFSTSLGWLAPDYAFWGKTPQLRKLIKAMDQQLARSESEDYVNLLVSGEAQTRRTVQDRLRGSGIGRGHLVRERTFDGRGELILFPTKFACALFHYSPPATPGAWVPFGFITNNLRKIEAVRKLFDAVASGNNYQGRLTWVAEDAPSPTENSFDNQLAFLRYLPV